MEDLTEQRFVAFLGSALSPDPIAQRENTAVMDQLIRSPSPQAVAYALAVHAGAAQYPLSHRQMAVAVLRRLLKKNPQGTLAVGGGLFQAHLSSLLAAAVSHNASSGSAMSTATALLIAAFLGKASEQRLPGGVSDSLWELTLQFIDQEAREAAACINGSVSRGELDEDACRRITGTATLLQILCEDSGPQLQQWLVQDDTRRGVSCPSARSLGLCGVFNTLLEAIYAALRALAENHVRPSGFAAATVTSGFAGVLAALASCFEEGVLPFENPFEDDDSGSEPGPAAADLSAVLTQVTALHVSVEQYTVMNLLPWIGKQHAEKGCIEDHQATMMTALFKYLSVMVLAPGTEIRKANERLLHAAVVTLTRALWPSAQASCSETVEKAVDASLVYLSDAALLASSEAFFLCLPQIFNALLPLAMLPEQLVLSQEYMAHEHDTELADDPAAVKLVLSSARANTAVTGVESDTDSSSGEDDTAAKRVGGGALLSGPRFEGTTTTTVEVDEEEGPSGNSRRSLITTVMNSISAAYENPGHLIEYLFPAGSATFGALATDPSQGDARTAEAVLFVLNNVVEECLAAPNLSQAQVHHVGGVAFIILDALRDGHLAATPFYVRQQAIRFLARSTAAAVESLLRTCPSPASEFFSVIQPDTLLVALSEHMCCDTSKVVQREYVAAISAICGSSLQPSLDDLGEDDDEDDDDVEDSTMASGRGKDESGKVSFAAGARLTSSQAFAAHLQAALFSPADNSPIQVILSRFVSVFPKLQLGPRTAVYDFFSVVIPRMSDRGIAFHPLVVGKLLEVLAVHFQALSFQSESTAYGEAAYALVTLSQVVAALGTLVVPAVPFFTSMARHVMEAWQAHQETVQVPFSKAATGSSIDPGDLCELSMDLLSALCDALIDHDRLLPEVLKHTPIDGTGASAVGNLHLRQALFTHEAGKSVWSLCTEILLSSAPMPNTSGSDNAFDDLRRACFGLVYDCLFLASPAHRSEVFWPLVNATLVGELSSLMNANSMKHLLQIVESKETVVANALLSLAELLCLYQYDGNSEGYSAGFRTTLAQARPFLESALDRFLLILTDKGKAAAALPTNVKLNMVNALSGIGALLVVYRQPQTSQVEVSSKAVQVIQVVASHLARFSSSLQEDGCYEMAQVLTGVLRMIQALPVVMQSSLPGLLRSNRTLASAVAKVLVAVSKCAGAFSEPRSAATVLGDWAEVAQAFKTAGTTAMQLSKAEKRSIEAVRCLGA